MTNAMTTTNANSELTMSSLEIATLMEIRHDNVKRTVKRLGDRGVFALPPLEDVQQIGGNGHTYTSKAYLIDQRASYIVVVQLCPEFTARLVDRWQELEAQVVQAPALPDFSNPAAAARAWAEEYEQKQLVSAQRDSALKTIGQSNQTVSRVAATFSEMSRIDQFY